MQQISSRFSLLTVTQVLRHLQVHPTHAVVLLILVVVPRVAHGHLLFPQALQALVVDLDARGRCGTRCVVSKMLLMWCSRRVADSRVLGGGKSSCRSMRSRRYPA